MADTTFVPGTVIASSWLNDVNTDTYKTLIVNVKLPPYNAVGDGVADDTAAIQAALTFVAQSKISIIATKVDVVTGIVYLPAGIYKTSAPLQVGEGTTFEGASQSSSIIKPTHTGIAVLMGNSSREYSQIKLRHLGIIGNRSGTLSKGSWASTTTIGIYAENCIRECSIQDCFITQCQTSIQAEKSYAFEINQNYLIYALNYHIQWDNAVAGRISGNRIDWSEQHGIYLNGSNVSDETLALEISSNAIQICWKNGLWLYDVSSATVSNNFFEGNYREATSDLTHDYADINIQTGPNNRGYSFTVQGNFFTHGSSPNFDSYTAIRCDRAQALVCISNTCRDSRYWRIIDASSVNIERIVALGNTFLGIFTPIVYDSAVTFGIIEEQIGLGAITVPRLTTGSFQRGATVSSSNQTSGLYKSIYLIDCSGGNRSLTMRDIDCVAGREYIIKKTTGDSNILSVQREGGSTKTFDGATSLTSTAAYGVIRITSNGTNWFTY
jgi:hypothetical protein